MSWYAHRARKVVDEVDGLFQSATPAEEALRSINTTGAYLHRATRLCNAQICFLVLFLLGKAVPTLQEVAKGQSVFHFCWELQLPETLLPAGRKAALSIEDY